MCAYGPLLPLSHNAALIHLAVFPLPLFKLLFRYIYINPSLNLPDILFHGGIHIQKHGIPRQHLHILIFRKRPVTTVQIGSKKLHISADTIRLQIYLRRFFIKKTLSVSRSQALP